MPMALVALMMIAPGSAGLSSPVSVAEKPVETGLVEVGRDQPHDAIPERYQLEPQRFPYELRLKYDLARSGVRIFSVRFPSAVTSPHPVNNIVHGELFLPRNPGRYPAVIVLDILDGKQLVSRGEALWLAQHGIAAMTVVMPYYGPRRPSEVPHRMLSPNIELSLQNVRQAVLDCRRAAAFLAAHPQVNPDRLGVVGTSLGSFVGSLVAAAEPRVRSACLLLGGGGLVDAFWHHPRAMAITPVLQLFGISKGVLAKQIAPVDPLTYADQLKSKRLLLIAASRDDVVPPTAMQRLWEATGKPKILWLDATHVGAAAYAFPAMEAIILHLREENDRKK